MRLETTKGKPLVEVRCVKCLCLCRLGSSVYADLDGYPFVDYYCAGCVEKIMKEHGSSERTSP